LNISKIAVMGSGTMGSQIAMICAMRGYSVVVYDINDENLKKTKESLQNHMNGRMKIN
jgi:3-hydroxybutyryl-CoA dehydrogenase